MLKTLLLLLFAYLLGSVPVGVLVAEWFNGNDPRHSGSGNIGATNVARTAGKKAGIITLCGDCLKGLLAVLAARACGAGDGLLAFTGFVAFLGHLYPIFIGFKGGKGVATALGILLAIAPLPTLAGIVLFAAVAGISHFVSLGSITAAAAMPLFLCQAGYNWKIVYTALLMAVFIIYRHRDNIMRLCQKTENRFF
ncbi:MAG: glycerol-3-phosphate 1-O-acyltransferase PlsY [Deltaproteobacteria bacterium]|nr:glycerol-3-phosphate 1-O-acyltransferase PlsY [Deltaproteobacteria bacterium]